MQTQPCQGLLGGFLETTQTLVQQDGQVGLWMTAGTRRGNAARSTAQRRETDEGQLAELQKVTDLKLAVTHRSGDAVNAALAKYQLPAKPVVVEDLDGELAPPGAVRGA
ncbi:unnamed protein product [Durusdinium trenchii]|uniref:Uncharacterized protein n=1 Tax=Durusdinium trenchii TaxID=1381693 RepID=A0ABP0QAR8_9DINO